MPTVTRTCTVESPPGKVWKLVGDAHHLPRWWPRVKRVEAVDARAFTEVMRSSRGRDVRADFTLVEDDQEAMRLVWAQRVVGTPFERILKSAETEIRLQESGRGTEVTIMIRQVPRGVFAHLGSYLIKRAAAATAEEALDGLQRIV